MSKVIVIGSGFAGISCATFLAKEGYDVTVLEKNTSIGGRARKFNAKGFTFDMGPSWYWMPDVFERYFGEFNHKVSDYYDLKRLTPSYQIYTSSTETVEIPASLDELYDLFESLEKGSSKKLKQFLAEAKYKYEVGINDLVHKPSLRITEFADTRILTGLVKMHLLKSFSKHTDKLFKSPVIRQILEFPILFLGAKPSKTPALYSLMNYADLELGTWYPDGGMNRIIEGMEKLAVEQGVKFITNQNVTGFNFDNNKIKSVITDAKVYESDLVISGADYHHTETILLPKEKQSYSSSYWDKRVLAPSSLIFYLGIDKKIPDLKHHNLFFDEDFDIHAEEIYDDPTWPSKPLFYACCPSKTDKTVAPEGKENLFLLIPIAPDLEDNESIRKKYLDIVITRLEKATKTSIKEDIIFKRSFAVNDFKSEYNSFKGNAYGLANTLKQTAFLKPKIKSKKVSNLFYTGQLTTPGPGVPPSLISGEVVAKYITKNN